MNSERRRRRAAGESRHRKKLTDLPNVNGGEFPFAGDPVEAVPLEGGQVRRQRQLARSMEIIVEPRRLDRGLDRLLVGQPMGLVRRREGFAVPLFDVFVAAQAAFGPPTGDQCSSVENSRFPLERVADEVLDERPDRRVDAELEVGDGEMIDVPVAELLRRDPFALLPASATGGDVGDILGVAGHFIADFGVLRPDGGEEREAQIDAALDLGREEGAVMANVRRETVDVVELALFPPTIHFEGGGAKRRVFGDCPFHAVGGLEETFVVEGAETQMQPTGPGEGESDDEREAGESGGETGAEDRRLRRLASATEEVESVEKSDGAGGKDVERNEASLEEGEEGEVEADQGAGGFSSRAGHEQTKAEGAEIEQQQCVEGDAGDVRADAVPTVAVKVGGRERGTDAEHVGIASA